MEIMRLENRQLHKASEVLAAAFFEYPMFTFYFPEPRHRSRYLPWYFKNILTTALRYGAVYTTPEISGVVFTLPPGHTKISIPEYLQCGFFLTPLVMGLRNYVRSMECEDFVGVTQIEIMANRPHYYLWGLAVEPGQKRQGIGASLLKVLLNQADAEGMPIYLETHDEHNVAYYQRYGFDLVRATQIPKHHLPIWCMVRETV